MRLSFVSILVTAIVLVSISSSASAQTPRAYVIAAAVRLETEDVPVPFGRPCPGLRGVVSDFNESGEVVGFLPKDETRGNGFHFVDGKLKRLKGSSGGSEALAINDDSVIVGVTYKEARKDQCDVGRTPFPAQWVDGELSLLELPEGASAGLAVDVNSGGIIAGIYTTGDIESNLGLENGTKPVFWSNGHVTELPMKFDLQSAAAEFTTWDSFYSARVNSVDDDGNFYGYGLALADKGAGSRPFSYAVIWRADKSVARVVGPAGSAAWSNGNGRFAVGTSLDANVNLVPTLFEETAISGLPMPAESTLDGTSAVAVGAVGQIVGGTLFFVSKEKAYIWEMSGGGESAVPIDLNEITQEPNAFNLDRLVAISPQGSILVTGSDRRNVLHFVILDPVLE